jgi:SAM-dependent methyltransferase
VHCLVCEGEVPAENRMFRSLLRCPACGFVFADLPISEDDARHIYGVSYFAGGEYADYVGDKPVLQRNFAHRIETLATFSPGGRLFEIGSAYGFFLELARERWLAAGIDIAEEASAYAREQLKLDVRCGDFLETNLENDAYDVFCMWDTIEHLREPDRYVEKVAEHLRSGGHLALTTGDIGSRSARLQGSHWRLIHPPSHLAYFSVPTLTRLLRRCGLDVVHVSHPGFSRSLGAMVRPALRRINGWGTGIGKWMDRTNWARASVQLNLFDIMYVIARKG